MRCAWWPSWAVWSFVAAMATKARWPTNGRRPWSGWLSRSACSKYAAGKNTADIALALDALEALFDGRADTFCLVTSDSDFAYLCRKLRERGAAVCIVGEPKTPDALRNASYQFFEWIRSEPTVDEPADVSPKSTKPEPGKAEPSKPELTKPVPKRQPRIVIDAVALLAGDTPEGKVGLGALGQYLKRTDPAFTPNTYGHSGLLNMLKTYEPVLEPRGRRSLVGRPRTQVATRRTRARQRCLPERSESRRLWWMLVS